MKKENINQQKRKQNRDSKQKSGTSVSKNKEFAVITYLFLAIFICLMGYMVYFQTVKSEDFINSPYNSRQDTFADRVVRGKIMSADGKVLAETVVDAVMKPGNILMVICMRMWSVFPPMESQVLNPI